jgi:hypothetical protein
MTLTISLLVLASLAYSAIHDFRQSEETTRDLACNA